MVARHVGDGTGPGFDIMPERKEPRTPEETLREAAAYLSGCPALPPFAGGRPTRRYIRHYLDYASYYLAVVICEGSGHQHDEYNRSEAWPCLASLAFAMEEIHRLAESKITKDWKGGSREDSEEEGKKPRNKPSRKPSGSSIGGRSAGRGKPVRRKR